MRLGERRVLEVNVSLYLSILFIYLPIYILHTHQLDAARRKQSKNRRRQESRAAHFFRLSSHLSLSLSALFSPRRARNKRRRNSCLACRPGITRVAGKSVSHSHYIQALQGPTRRPN